MQVLGEVFIKVIDYDKVHSHIDRADRANCTVTKAALTMLRVGPVTCVRYLNIQATVLPRFRTRPPG